MKVLAVDDDELVQDLVTLKLGQAGYEVTTAADGRSGLDLALGGGFDLVLLDVMLPRLSGIEVCRRLRDDPRTSATPVLLLTLRSLESDVEHGFAAGADDYMVKPFSPKELLSRVQALTGGRPHARSTRATGAEADGTGAPPAAGDDDALRHELAELRLVVQALAERVGTRPSRTSLARFRRRARR